MTSPSGLLQSLSEPTRRELRNRLGVVFDIQLTSLTDRQRGSIIRSSRDTRLVDEYLAQRVQLGGPMVLIQELLCGLLLRPIRGVGECVIRVQSYANRTPLSSIDERIPELAAMMLRTSGYPTRQGKPSCAAHAGGSHCHLRGTSAPEPMSAPSRRFIYVQSGRAYGYSRSNGRQYGHIMQLLLDHGYLTEGELPTGQDDYDEGESYSEDQLELARERACAGAVSIENNDTRLRVALDLVRGAGFYRPCGLMIACMIYENWARCFSHGVLVRHSDRDRRLGGHALLLLGFIRIDGIIFAALLNSWAGFAAQSPLGTTGCALVDVEYLEEIMFHGALYICQTDEEWQTACGVFGAGGAPRARRSVFVLPAVTVGAWWRGNCERVVAQSRARLAEALKQ